MAKISELKAVVEGMTEGKENWPIVGAIACEHGWQYTVKSLHDVEAIDKLRDHADALIELVEACISVLNQLDVVKNRYAIKELENALQKLENI